MMNQTWRLKKQEIRRTCPKYREGLVPSCDWGAQRRRSKEGIRMETQFGAG